MTVPNDWLQKHTHLLVDMSDLILVQECIRLQNEQEWFPLGKAYIQSFIPTNENHAVRRRGRWIKRGLLEQKMIDGRPHQTVYRLCNLD